VSVPSDRILSALSATESILTQSINPELPSCAPIGRRDSWRAEKLGCRKPGSRTGLHRARRYFKSSRKTTPPFITNLTRCISVMSASGSPETATRSAYLPFSTIPT